MDAIQESLNQMMETFHQRLDTIEGQLPQKTPASPGSLATEFAAFKAFVMVSFRALQGQIGMLAQQVDQGEMRSRRKILLLHGVPEDQKENTNTVVAKEMLERLKLAGFSSSDISRCHRMGRAAGKDRPRPILFKLREVTLREKIWSSKTLLKGSGVTLSEFLTKTRHDVFLAARQRFGVTKCWTREGNIYVLGPDGVRHRVSCLGDLGAIVSKETAKPAVPSKQTTGAAPSKTRRAAAAKK